MSDYISRADAIEMAVDVETPKGTYERAIYVDDLMALPSADAVSLTGTMKYLTKPHNYCEVVRCKDCRHHGMMDCPVWGDDTTEDYMWCYYGERSEK